MGCHPHPLWDPFSVSVPTHLSLREGACTLTLNSPSVRWRPPRLWHACYTLVLSLIVYELLVCWEGPAENQIITINVGQRRKWLPSLPKNASCPRLKPWNPAVLVSEGCCNKVLQSRWLTHRIYCLTVLEVRRHQQGLFLLMAMREFIHTTPLATGDLLAIFDVTWLIERSITPTSAFIFTWYFQYVCTHKLAFLGHLHFELGPILWPHFNYICNESSSK